MLAITFKIKDYEKLENTKYVVKHIDKNKINNHINNLEVVSRAIIGSANGKKVDNLIILNINLIYL